MTDDWWVQYVRVQQCEWLCTGAHERLGDAPVAAAERGGDEVGEAARAEHRLGGGWAGIEVLYDVDHLHEPEAQDRRLRVRLVSESVREARAKRHHILLISYQSLIISFQIIFIFIWCAHAAGQLSMLKYTFGLEPKLSCWAAVAVPRSLQTGEPQHNKQQSYHAIRTFSAPQSSTPASSSTTARRK